MTGWFERRDQEVIDALPAERLLIPWSPNCGRPAHVEAESGVPVFVRPQRAFSVQHRATKGRKLNGAPRNLL